MTTVIVPASDDGRFPECYYTALPSMPDAWKSKKVPVATLIQMTKREHHLRVEDDTYQHLFLLSHRNGPGDAETFTDLFTTKFMEITGISPKDDPAIAEEPLVSSASVIILIQYDVLNMFGYHPLKDALVLYELRTAAMMHPEVEALQASVQFRYNRQGYPVDGVEEGVVGPNCALHSADELTPPTTLHDLLRELTQHQREASEAKGHRFKHFPTVVISGSYT